MKIIVLLLLCCETGLSQIPANVQARLLGSSACPGYLLINETFGVDARKLITTPAPGVWSNSGYNWWNTTGWTGSACKVGSSGLGAFSTDPNLPVNPGGPASGGKYLFLTNCPGSYARTPVMADGLGAIYFEAVQRNSSELFTGSFTVDVSTNGGSDWITVAAYSISGTTILRPAIPLNIRVPAMVRFYRTSRDPGDPSNASWIVIDNVRISAPW